MGLFSGGGLLGDIGNSLGLNTDKQQANIAKAGAASQAQTELGIEGITAAGEAGRLGFEPFQQAGLGGLAGFQQGSTFGGFQSNIQDILGSGLFDDITAQRQTAASNALGQAGLSRSGGGIQELAAIPSDVGLNLALQIEGMLSGRQQGLAGIGQQAAGNIAGSLSTDASNIANLRTGLGATQSSTILGQGQVAQAGRNNIGSLISGGLSAAGAGGAFGGGILGGLATAFSDIRLKTNIIPLATVGDLTLYKWDWIDGIEELMPDEAIMLNAGFLAQDIEKLYPQYSGESLGFKTIDYDGLLTEIALKEAASCQL